MFQSLLMEGKERKQKESKNILCSRVSFKEGKRKENKTCRIPEFHLRKEKKGNDRKTRLNSLIFLSFRFGRKRWESHLFFPFSSFPFSLLLSFLIPR
ncbi:hypothetical protein HanRHA438_Chr10g0449111 [Helianthus annuus]|nr:hypothetical protein HanIR_Chr10g0471031 [Helianthus annuus]KAJ0879241.1 hypothetical protein HanRHA438_Chr10g0449111 [Helianthus annuus]